MTSLSQAARHLSEAECQTLVDFVHGISDRFGGQVRAIILFGSGARGEAELESDMDVAVVMSSVDAITGAGL